MLDLLIIVPFCSMRLVRKTCPRSSNGDENRRRTTGLIRCGKVGTRGFGRCISAGR